MQRELRGALGMPPVAAGLQSSCLLYTGPAETDRKPHVVPRTDPVQLYPVEWLRPGFSHASHASAQLLCF